MARGKISLARGIRCCSHFLLLPFLDQHLNFVKIMSYTHISDCVQTVYELPLLTNDHFYTNRSGTKCWPDIYHWGAGLAVTGWIRDIGQNVLHSSFLTGSSSSVSYLHIFFLIAFLEDAFVRNIKIIVCFDYIIVCINQSNAPINNTVLQILDNSTLWLSEYTIFMLFVPQNTKTVLKCIG
jgi:hypothetical protein